MHKRLSRTEGHNCGAKEETMQAGAGSSAIRPPRGLAPALDIPTFRAIVATMVGSICIKESNRLLKEPKGFEVPLIQSDPKQGFE